MELKEQLIAFQKFARSFFSAVNAWKEKLKKDFLLLAREKVRPNLVDDEMVQKIRNVLTESSLREQ